MNLLFVAAYPPVLHLHGGGVRMFHNIRILAKKHRVHVLSFVENAEERELLKSVEPICESVAGVQRIPDFTAHWFSLKPFLVNEFATPAMHEAVDQTIRRQKIEVIQCEYLQMAQYRRRGIFSVLTAHEAMSANAYRAFQDARDPVTKLQLFSRWMAALNYEVSMCNRFDRVVTMTKQDADYLRSYAHRADIRDIPIGIDADYFQPRAAPSTDRVEVLFIGNFRHTPNIEAATFLLENVAPEFPRLQFVIAGPYVPEAMRTKSNVTFLGYVPDMRHLFNSPNTIFAAPLFSGTGQRVKLLEAFAMACPVITTSLGAAGFPIVTGEQAWIADTAQEFCGALRILAADKQKRLRSGSEARRMIMENFTWDRLSPRFWDLVDCRRGL